MNSSEPDVDAIRERNRQSWDRLLARDDGFTRPAEDDACRDPLGTVDPLGWLEGDLRGKKVLCLAAGGGRQGPIYASAGAIVTVVDLSPAMLARDREVAARRQLNLRTVETSMDQLEMFEAGEFDVVIHPVSTCYLPDVLAVYREVARVTRGGGIYVSQHKTPTSLQASITPLPQGYVLTESYYRKGPLPEVTGTRLREEGCYEFIHRWEQLIGGMCRVGFVIEDLVEPYHAKEEAEIGEFGHRARYIAPYVRIKARRVSQAVAGSAVSSSLWLPS